MKAPTLLLTAMTTCILFSSCQKSDLSENKNLLKNSANAEKSNLFAKKQNIAIGDYYGGGIVYFIDASGEHGLIASTKDLGTSPWGCNGVLVNGTAWEIGSGAANTDTILKYCNQDGIAARICHDLIARETLLGSKNVKFKEKEIGKKYDDWYLPSPSEMSLLLEASYRSEDPVLINLFPTGEFWTSAQGPITWHGVPESPAHTAFTYFHYSKLDATINYVLPAPSDKSDLFRVRAIRAF